MVLQNQLYKIKSLRHLYSRHLYSGGVSAAINGDSAFAGAVAGGIGKALSFGAAGSEYRFFRGLGAVGGAALSAEIAGGDPVLAGLAAASAFSYNELQGTETRLENRNLRFLLGVSEWKQDWGFQFGSKRIGARIPGTDIKLQLSIGISRWSRTAQQIGVSDIYQVEFYPLTPNYTVNSTDTLKNSYDKSLPPRHQTRTCLDLGGACLSVTPK